VQRLATLCKLTIRPNYLRFPNFRAVAGTSGGGFVVNADAARTQMACNYRWQLSMVSDVDTKEKSGSDPGPMMTPF
jgi:hypothetical protein